MKESKKGVKLCRKFFMLRAFVRSPGQGQPFLQKAQSQRSKLDLCMIMGSALRKLA